MAQLPDVLGGLHRMTFLVGKSQVAVAIVAGQFPRNDVFNFPRLRRCDLAFAEVATAGVEREEATALLAAKGMTAGHAGEVPWRSE